MPNERSPIGNRLALLQQDWMTPEDVEEAKRLGLEYGEHPAQEWMTPESAKAAEQILTEERQYPRYGQRDVLASKPVPVEREREDPGLALKTLLMGLRVIPSMGGGLLGPAAGGVGGAGGETIAQTIEKLFGIREQYNPKMIAAEAAIGAIPMGKVAKGIRGVSKAAKPLAATRRMDRIYGEAAKGAGIGGLSSGLYEAADEEEGINPLSIAAGTALGGLLGGGGTALATRATTREAIDPTTSFAEKITDVIKGRGGGSELAGPGPLDKLVERVLRSPEGHIYDPVTGYATNLKQGAVYEPVARSMLKGYKFLAEKIPKEVVPASYLFYMTPQALIDDQDKVWKILQIVKKGGTIGKKSAEFLDKGRRKLFKTFKKLEESSGLDLSQVTKDLEDDTIARLARTNQERSSKKILGSRHYVSGADLTAAEQDRLTDTIGLKGLGDYGISVDPDQFAVRPDALTQYAQDYALRIDPSRASADFSGDVKRWYKDIVAKGTDPEARLDDVVKLKEVIGSKNYYAIATETRGKPLDVFQKEILKRMPEDSILHKIKEEFRKEIPGESPWSRVTREVWQAGKAGMRGKDSHLQQYQLIPQDAPYWRMFSASQRDRASHNLRPTRLRPKNFKETNPGLYGDTINKPWHQTGQDLTGIIINPNMKRTVEGNIKRADQVDFFDLQKHEDLEDFFNGKIDTAKLEWSDILPGVQKQQTSKMTPDMHGTWSVDSPVRDKLQGLGNYTISLGRETLPNGETFTFVSIVDQWGFNPRTTGLPEAAKKGVTAVKKAGLGKDVVIYERIPVRLRSMKKSQAHSTLAYDTNLVSSQHRPEEEVLFLEFDRTNALKLSKAAKADPVKYGDYHGVVDWDISAQRDLRYFTEDIPSINQRVIDEKILDPTTNINVARKKLRTILSDNDEQIRLHDNQTHNIGNQTLYAKAREAPGPALNQRRSSQLYDDQDLNNFIALRRREGGKLTPMSYTDGMHAREREINNMKAVSKAEGLGVNTKSAQTLSEKAQTLERELYLEIEKDKQIGWMQDI